jgi:phosphotriesterase-related protein
MTTMTTLNFFKAFSILSLGLCLSLLFSCNTKESRIITVTGEIPASEIGKTLHHEHLLVDFIGADSTGYHRWDKNEVVEKVLPYLSGNQKTGIQNFG